MSCVARVAHIVLQFVIIAAMAILTGVTLAASGVAAAEISSPGVYHVIGDGPSRST